MGMETNRREIAEIIENAAPYRRSDMEYQSKDACVMSPKVFKVPDNTKLPLRQWVYGNRLIRGRVSMTLAPGGLGKSGLTMAEAVDMASGMGLMGAKGVSEKLRVMVWNLEDPDDEMTKRFTAICMHYKITSDDLGDRLHYSSVEESLVITHTDKSGTIILEAVVAALVEMLKRRRIDVLIVDPFISCHDASENDNATMDRIAKTWVRVALEANCAIELVHHSRKLNGANATTDASRGASAITNAARNVRVLNGMKEEDAVAAGVHNHRRYFRAINDKANLSPPSEGSDWFQMVNINLLNGTFDLGDDVGVVTKWQWPDAAEGLPPKAILTAQHAIHGGKYRKSLQADDWAGHKIGQALEIDTSDPFGAKKVSTLINSWLKNGQLKVIFKRVNSRDTPFIEVGEWMK